MFGTALSNSEEPTLNLGLERTVAQSVAFQPFV